MHHMLSCPLCCWACAQAYATRLHAFQEHPNTRSSKIGTFMLDAAQQDDL